MSKLSIQKVKITLEKDTSELAFELFNAILRNAIFFIYYFSKKYITKT